MTAKTFCHSFGAFALSLAASTQPTMAEPVEIVSMILGDGLQLADHSGLYGELMESILDQIEYPTQFSVYPFKRALKSFFSNDAACIWALDASFLKAFGGEEMDLLESAPLMNTTQHLFTKSGSSGIADFSQLPSKTIGILNGANIDKRLTDAGARVVRLPSQEAKIDMLIADRLDAIGAWKPDIYITLDRMGHSPDLIEPRIDLSHSGVGIVCRNSPATAMFIADADAAISALLASPAFYDLLVRYGVHTEEN